MRRKSFCEIRSSISCFSPVGWERQTFCAWDRISAMFEIDSIVFFFWIRFWGQSRGASQWKLPAPVSNSAVFRPLSAGGFSKPFVSGFHLRLSYGCWCKRFARCLDFFSIHLLSQNIAGALNSSRELSPKFLNYLQFFQCIFQIRRGFWRDLLHESVWVLFDLMFYVSTLGLAVPMHVIALTGTQTELSCTLARGFLSFVSLCMWYKNLPRALIFRKKPIYLGFAVCSSLVFKSSVALLFESWWGFQNFFH